MLKKNEKHFTRYRSTASFNLPIFPMSTQIENTTFDDSCFQTHLPQIYRTVLKDFRKAVQSYIFFHVFFLTLIGFETLFFLPFITTSAMVALGLGSLFLTIFCYLVLHFYLQARKPEKLLYLQETFLQSCRRHIEVPPGEAQHHLSISEAIIKLVSYLEGFEKNFYRLPSFFQFANPIFSKLSSYCYWKDVFKLKRDLAQRL